MNSLWALFIVLQVYNAGNINYQQENGYYEINPIYGRHPSKQQVYMTKIGETLAVYGATKLFPDYKKEILIGANSVALAFVYSDIQKGINIAVRF